MNDHVFRYSGPVLYFDQVICSNWTAETTATSDKQARNNLTYKYKKAHNFAPRSCVTLPGKIIVVK